MNAVSFAAVLASLAMMREGELHRRERKAGPRGSLADGFRYILGRPDLVAIVGMLFLVGTFVLNFRSLSRRCR